MRKENALRRYKAQGVGVQLAGENNDASTTSAVRAQVLSRYGIPSSLCALVGALHYGSADDAL